MKDIILSRYCDFCNGVKKTINICEDVLEKYDYVYSLGQVIHNTQVIDKLKEKGLNVVKDISDVPLGAPLLIRSHGISQNAIELAEERGLNLIDAACSFVKYIQNICVKLKNEKYFIVITGDKNHPEVEALKDISGINSVVVSDSDKDVNIQEQTKKIAVVSQSTYTEEGFYSKISNLLNKEFSEIRIFNTICRDSLNRRQEAKKVASVVEMVIIIGGQHSANTRRLFQISKKVNSNSYHLDNPDKTEDNFWAKVKKANSIGIIAGASTPGWIIDDFLRRIPTEYNISSLKDMEKCEICK